MLSTGLHLTSESTRPLPGGIGSAPNVETLS